MRSLLALFGVMAVGIVGMLMLPEEKQIPYIGALSLAFIGSAIYLTRLNNRRRVEKLSDRPDLPLDSLYDEFYAETRLPREDVKRIYAAIAGVYKASPGVLRPGDLFSVELGSQAPDIGLSVDPFPFIAQRVVKSLQREYPNLPMQCSQEPDIDGLVRYLCSAIDRVRGGQEDAGPPPAPPVKLTKEESRKLLGKILSEMLELRRRGSRHLGLFFKWSRASPSLDDEFVKAAGFGLLLAKQTYDGVGWLDIPVEATEYVVSRFAKALSEGRPMNDATAEAIIRYQESNSLVRVAQKLTGKTAWKLA